MDYNPPHSSVHGILQARILEWVTISHSRDLLETEIEPASLMSPALIGRYFTISATWVAQRRTVPRNLQATIKLCSFNMLLRLYSKSFKLGFSMYKLDFEKVEEPKNKNCHFSDHRESKGIPEKHLFLLH